VRSCKGKPQGRGIVYVCGHGSRRTLRCNAAPILDESGRIQAAVLVLDNVTDRKAQERALKKRPERAKKQRRGATSKRTRVKGVPMNEHKLPGVGNPSAEGMHHEVTTVSPTHLKPC
jgi:hypothetical protein